MMRSLLLLSVFLLVQCVVSEDKQVNLCGRDLARARVLLCYGSEYLYKRSPNAIDASVPGGGSGAKLGDWVWGGRRDALAARWGRHKRGLVDECCLKACSVDVIRMYC